MSTGAGFLEFCAISVSSDGIDIAEGGDILSFPVVSMARVLLSWRYCSGVVRVIFFSVDSLGRVKLIENNES